MLFQNLRLRGWRQFRSVNLDLHPRLTVLTGANGAGKTTLLSMLGRHFGWYGQFISTPRRRKGFEGVQYGSDYWRSDKLAHLERLEAMIEELREEVTLDALGADEELIDSGPPTPGQPERDIGTLAYTNGMTAQLRVPTAVGSVYQVNIFNQQPVRGLFIPSHRPLYGYQPLQTIPAVPRRRNELFEQYTNIVRARYQGQHVPQTPNYFLKEAVIALALFGRGNDIVEPNPEALSLFEEFQTALALVLPPTMGFQRLVVRMPEVVLMTKTGDFSLDAVSGGVASIIDLAWQLFMFAPRTDSFAVTIDEPENHLHPELQRTVLSSLLNAFPAVQFIVASHNPFIVSSVPDSNVYVLSYDKQRRVRSQKLDTVNRAGSSNEILRDVLGLDFTIPLWVERRLEAVVAEFAAQDLTQANLDRLRERLDALGLGSYVPGTIAQVVQQRAAQ